MMGFFDSARRRGGGLRRETKKSKRQRKRSIRMETLERRNLLASITTLAQLQSMSLSGSHTLNADIDASGSFFTPVGTSASPFTGSLDGNGYKITGLKISSSAQYVGLFGYASGASVTDVVLEDVNIDSNYSGSDNAYVGGIAGYAYNTDITDSEVTGDIDVLSYGGMYLGGMVGYGYSTADDHIQDSRTDVDLFGHTDSDYYGGGGYGGYVGGFIGYANDMDIDGSSASGDVMAYGGGNTAKYAGGLIGYNYLYVSSGTKSSDITESFAEGDVDAHYPQFYGGGYGGAYAGGLIGYNYTYSASSGNASMNMERSYSDSTVAANDGSAYGGGYAGAYAGGLIGYNYLRRSGTVADVDLSNDYATGDTTATSYGSAYAGGLIGYTYSYAATTDLLRNYATGTPTTVNASTSYNGGVIGFSSGSSSTFSDVFWDTQTSGTSDGVDNIDPDPSGVTGKTTNEMHRQSTFTNWDFANDWIMAGYPHLRMEHDHLRDSGGSKVITNVAQLQMMSLDLTEDYILGNDIDASATDGWNYNGTDFDGFLPIGRDTSNAFDRLNNAFEGVDFDGTAFTGSLDGDGFSIDDLFIDRDDEDFIGLFGKIDDPGLTTANRQTRDAAILDLTLNDPKITGRRFIGGLAGLSDAKIENVSVTATSATEGTTSSFITAGGSLPDVNNVQRDVGFAVGGLVGKAGTDDTTVSVIDTSTTEILVQHDGSTHLLNVGGLAGQVNDDGFVINSRADGDVIAQVPATVVSHTFREVNDTTGLLQNKTFELDNHVGGLVGEQDGDVTGTVVNSVQQYSIATGKVTGFKQTGGLIGALDGTLSFGKAENPDAQTDNPILGEDQIGGLIGRIDNDPGATATDSFAQRTVGSTGNPVDDKAGGFVGKNAGGTVSNSLAIATVHGLHHVGGFVGENEGGTITDSHATVDLQVTNGGGDEEAGGFAGQNGDGGVIRRSYATGSITIVGVGTASRVGGFIGDNNHTGTTVTDSFSDVGGAGVTAGNGFFGRQNSVTAPINVHSTTSDGTAATTTLVALQTVIGGAHTHGVFNRAGNTWDFVNDWNVNVGALPTLR